MSLVDYKDRKIDIMMTDGYTDKLSFIFPNKIVAGIQKMVQNFILRFFTALGSNIIDQNAGTQFAQELKTAPQVESGYIYQLMSMAVTDVASQMQQVPSNFDDENIESARISSFESEKGYANVGIELISKVGESYEFIVPITVPIS